MSNSIICPDICPEPRKMRRPFAATRRGSPARHQAAAEKFDSNAFLVWMEIPSTLLRIAQARARSIAPVLGLTLALVIISTMPSA